MKIECCHHCESRHEKCHGHCETYLTQKILKIMVEANEQKERRTAESVKAQKDRMIIKTMHDNHLRRRK